MILHSAHGRTWDPGRPVLMAILNATPDSFSDGGMLAEADVGRVVADLLAEGADILDVGGESTRPGHAPVPVDEEIRRVVPVIEAIRRSHDVWISIDTQKAAVAEAALKAGADFVNDVSGLRDPGMARLVRDRGCSVVLMRDEDCHGDVVRSCRDQLWALQVRARASGVADDQVILDPGLGFGASPGPDPEANMALVRRIGDYRLGRPVLIGASRKRFIGAMTGIEDPVDRDPASADIAAEAVAAGADIVRVHNVAATRDALQCV